MATTHLINKDVIKAADVIRKAKYLIITAGAGMGVDSGLPDFRGPEGFWRAYPPLRNKRLALENMSTPHWFDEDPKFAWGFFGHRFNLYKSTKPHKGFDILHKWCTSMDKGYFVFTSNVDGHFQKAGFPEDRVCECHGSINHFQCCETLGSDQIWPAPEDTHFEVNMDEIRLTSGLPKGPPGKNNKLARPNILMFGDWTWVDRRTKIQQSNFYKFQTSIARHNGAQYAVIEIGAGEYVPTIRMTSEGLVRASNKGTLIRINPRDSHMPRGNLSRRDYGVSLKMSGLEALESIDNVIDKGLTE